MFSVRKLWEWKNITFQNKVTVSGLGRLPFAAWLMLIAAWYMGNSFSSYCLTFGWWCVQWGEGDIWERGTGDHRWKIYCPIYRQKRIEHQMWESEIWVMFCTKTWSVTRFIPSCENLTLSILKLLQHFCLPSKDCDFQEWSCVEKPCKLCSDNNFHNSVYNGIKVVATMHLRTKYT